MQHLPMPAQTWRRLLVTLVVCAALVFGSAAAAETCAGDCNNDRVVAIDEIVLAVNAALGRSSISACPAVDLDSNLQVTINELVVAINHLLVGCPPDTDWKEAFDASEIGWMTREVESRLLLARLGLGPGDTVAGRAVLKAVEEDARALGLKRFARLAAEAAEMVEGS